MSLLQPTYPDINGLKPDFYSLKFIVPQPVGAGLTSPGPLYAGPGPVGFTGIDFGDKLESGRLRGNAQFLLGKTSGKYTAKASLEMWLEDAYYLNSWLGATGVAVGLGSYEISWNLDIQFSVPGLNAGLTHSVAINGMRIASMDESFKESQDPLKVKLEIDEPFQIIRDGVIPVNPNAATFWIP